MQTEPLAIDGVEGPVVVVTKSWASCVVMVAGQEVSKVGNRYPLPATGGGVVEATVRSPFLADLYPVVVVNGIQYRTGPKPPVILQLLSLLPVLLALVGGALGGAIRGGDGGAFFPVTSVIGMMISVSVARRRMWLPAKVIVLVVIGVVTGLVYFVIATALYKTGHSTAALSTARARWK